MIGDDSLTAMPAPTVARQVRRREARSRERLGEGLRLSHVGRRRSGKHAADVDQQAGVSRSVAGVPIEEVAHGRDEEREDDGVGLAQLERALNVRLRGGRLAELLPGQRVEKQRLDHRERADHGGLAAEDRGEDLDGRRRVLVGAVDRRRRTRGLASRAVPTDSVERGAGGLPMSHRSCVGGCPHDGGVDCIVRETLRSLGGRETPAV